MGTEAQRNLQHHLTLQASSSRRPGKPKGDFRPALLLESKGSLTVSLKKLLGCKHLMVLMVQ